MRCGGAGKQACSLADAPADTSLALQGKPWACRTALKGLSLQPAWAAHPPTAPPKQAKAHRLDVHQQRDRATGDVFYILNGNQRFLEG